MSCLGNGNTDCNAVTLLISHNNVVSRKVIDNHDDKNADDNDIN